MKRAWWIGGLLLALLVVLLSPLASPHPDGLERVAEDHGFAGQARAPWFSVIPDYLFPGVGHSALGTILAGMVGVAVLFGLVFGLGRLMVRRRPGP